ncbi:hypothetical protein C8J57DRAFT_1523626 [Mycena rebaudengoi]|nr:hypothetical protein C8J57DRAFT_1523626 [Mycena rebaudengoi]
MLDEFKNTPEFAAVERERYETTGQGWMAANDTTMVFTPLSSIMDELLLSLKLKNIEIPEDQLEWLKQGRLPHLESVIFSRGLGNSAPGESCVNAGLQIGLQFTNRGIRRAAHTKSRRTPPTVDRSAHDFDTFSLLAAYRAIETLAQTPPLAEILAKQAIHPLRALVWFSLHGWSLLTRLTLSPAPSGTVAMARRDIGGVVGSNLLVHGTANLRIADASIILILLAAYIQATVYAIGEKAADLIKSGR